MQKKNIWYNRKSLYLALENLTETYKALMNSCKDDALKEFYAAYESVAKRTAYTLYKEYKEQHKYKEYISSDDVKKIVYRAIALEDIERSKKGNIFYGNPYINLLLDTLYTTPEPLMPVLYPQLLEDIYNTINPVEEKYYLVDIFNSSPEILALSGYENTDKRWIFELMPETMKNAYGKIINMTQKWELDLILRIGGADILEPLYPIITTKIKEVFDYMSLIQKSDTWLPLYREYAQLLILKGQ